MNATHLLYKTIHPDWVPKGSHNCLVCGCETDKKYKLGDNFTALDSLYDANSGYICDACEFGFTGQIQTTKENAKRNPTLRNYTHLVHGSDWHYLSKTDSDRQSVKKWLFEKKEYTWFACLSESGQRQLLYLTPLNYPCSDIFYIQFELEIICMRLKNEYILDFAQKMYQFLPKQALLTGDFPIKNLSEGLHSGLLEDDITKIMELKGNPIWRLGVFLATKGEIDERREQQRTAVNISRVSDNEARDRSNRQRDNTKSFDQLDLFTS